MTSSTLLVAVAKEGGGLSPSPRFVTDLNAFFETFAMVVHGNIS